MGVFHGLRILASFALLGGVLAGVLFGWSTSFSFEPRWIGAVIGVIVGFVIASNERRSHHAGAEAAHSV